MSVDRPLNILVIDDSAVVRQVMTSILSETPGMTVAVAADPLIAFEKMKRVRPDVILLDIEMPRMDGLTFLRHVMSEDPIPVVVCSALTDIGTEVAFRALEEGAVEILTKPKIGIQGFLEESATRLVDAIRAASVARISLLARRHALALRQGTLTAHASSPSHPALPRAASPALTTRVECLIAVGASTGGTEALSEFLGAMPADCPPIAVVQHMPERFTRAFAERLDRTCAITVREAVDGERITGGLALIAPGDYHLAVRVSGGHYVTEVQSGPPVSRHRPSVDVLFRSIALAAGPRAVGVIMTGMGDDGAAGLLEMKASGAATFAQDEATSVVFGMPREAIERGAAEAVLPLPQLAPAALQRAKSIRQAQES